MMGKAKGGNEGREKLGRVGPLQCLEQTADGGGCI